MGAKSKDVGLQEFNKEVQIEKSFIFEYLIGDSMRGKIFA